MKIVIFIHIVFNVHVNEYGLDNGRGHNGFMRVVGHLLKEPDV
jgi:hypothetical protein